MHEDATRYNPSDIAEAPWLATIEDTYAPTPESRPFPPARLESIVTGCAWLRHCRDDAARLPEPEWYGMLGIVGRCHAGASMAHAWSAPYPRYSQDETARKLQHALADAGPRTCSAIRYDLGGEHYCRDCQHWQTITSPIVLGMAMDAHTAQQQVQWRQNGTGSSRSSNDSEEASGGTPSRVPDPLRRELPPAAPYPVGAMGNLLAAMTRRLQDVIQAPDAICAQSVLAAATLACQAHRDVVIDGRHYPLSEYFVTLGESGERKTASDNRALWPHRERERELIQRHEIDTSHYENARDAYKKSREDILRKERSFSARRQALEQLGPPPVGPLKPLLLASEPTYEGLVRLLEEGQPSLGLFSNEGGRLIGGHGMNADHQLKTAAGLSELWDGQRVDRVRGGDGATALYGRRLSMHVMVQPGVAQLLLGNALLLEQGLLSRCLVAWPETTAGKRLYKAIDLSQDAAAKPLWIAFHDHIERQVAPEASLSPVRPFASKVAEHALRLAGVITVIETPEAMGIHRDAVQAGIDLVQFYIKEALRLFGASRIDPDFLLAEKLLLWAQHHDKIYLRQVYQYGPSSVRDAKTAKKLVAILEEHGWLTRVEGGAELDGAHRRDVWEVYRG